MLTPYLFGAYGLASLEHPTALERATTRGRAYGLGLRLGAVPRSSLSAVNMGLEYGHYELGDGLKEGNRVSFALSLQF